jgi:5-methyltetrahydropteroyltriglutamate--homocysteine methyltransferase
MEILLHNHSSYPRIGDAAGQQRLRRAHAARERGELDAAGLAAVECAVIDEIIHEEEAAGVDIVTDGQVRWSDPVAHLMAPLEGVRSNGLLRYFDTNCYFRQPVVSGPLRRPAPITCGDFARARLASRRTAKPVLTGPYTLARLSLDQGSPYGTLVAMAEALGEVLAGEVRDLSAAGAEVVQIDEPSILQHPHDIRLLRQVMEPIWAARGAAQIALATYFGDAEPLYAQLNSVPADIIILDFTYGPRLGGVIRSSGASKVLGVGLVDGRNTRMEDPQALAAQVESLLLRYPFETLHLLPSCGLEYLPRECARHKLELLARVRALLA